MEGFWAGELAYLRGDGTEIPGFVTAFPIRFSGAAGDETIAMTSIVRDLTEQKRQEAEREALQQQVIAAQQAAIRELSTPLIPIADGVVVMPLIGSIDSQRDGTLLDGWRGTRHAWSSWILPACRRLIRWWLRRSSRRPRR